MWSQPVAQALLEPGRQKITVRLANPARQRDWMVDEPISATDLAKQFTKAFDVLVEQHPQSFRGGVPSGKAGAAGGNDA